MMPSATHISAPFRSNAWQAAAGWLIGLLVLVAAAGTAPASAQLAKAPWAKAFADNRNSNQSTTLADVVPATTDLQPVHSPVATGPNGNLVFKTYGSSTLQLHSVRPDGTPNWSIDLTAQLGDGTAPTSPVIDEQGRIFFLAPTANSGAALHRVDADGSSLITLVDPGTSFIGAPALASDGRLYASVGNEVVSVNPDDGAVASIAVPDGSPLTAPTIAPDGRIIVATFNGGVFAVSPAGDVGESLIEGDGELLIPPAVGDGVIYVATTGDPEDTNSTTPKLIAINYGGAEEDGLNWSTLIESGIIKGIAIGPSNDVYVTTNNVQNGFSTLQRRAYEGGGEIWRSDASGTMSAPSIHSADPSVHVAKATGTGGAVRSFTAAGTELPTLSVGAPTVDLPPVLATNADLATGTTAGLVLSDAIRPTTSPSSLTFSPVVVGNTATADVTVNQPADAGLLNVTGVSISGPDAARFTLGDLSGILDGVTAGGSETVPLSFQSSTAGTFEATLIISTGLFGNLQVPLSGQAVQSGLSAQPNPLLFDIVQLGSSQTKTLELSSSDTDATITDATVTDDAGGEFDVPVSSLVGTQIDSGTPLPVDITFTPSARGVRSATLTVEVDNGPVTIDIPMEGEGVDASITASPSPADFGTLETGTALTKTVTLTNPGADALGISGIGIASTGSTDYSVTGGGDQTVLAGGSSITVDVTFQPTVGGTRTSELVVTTTEGPEARVSLTGVGVEPDLTVSPNPLDFGLIEASATATASFSIDNPKSVDVAVTGMSVDNADFQVVSPTSFTVAGNTTETVDVEFSPSTTGPVTGTLTVQTDAGFTRTLTLEGEAQEIGIAASPAPVEFQGTERATTSEILVTVTNTGTVSLNNLSTSITNNGDSEFSINETASTLGTSLAPGASADVAVQYTPDNTESNSGSLNITYDNLQEQPETLTVGLSGSGIENQSDNTLTFDRSVTFSDTAPGNRSVAETITLANDTGSDQNVTEIALGGTNPSSFEITEIRTEAGDTFTVNGTSFTNGGSALPLSGDGGSNEVFVDVVFAPGTEGDLGAQLTVSVDNNLNNATTVSGTAIAPTLTAAPNPLDLGSVAIGETTTSTVTLDNATSVDYSISSIGVVEANGATGFELSSPATAPDVVPANSSVTVDIVHASSTVGLEEAVLEVASPNNVLQVSLRAQVEDYSLVFTQSPVTFAAVPVDSSTSETVVIENTGSAALAYSVNNIAGTNDGDFDVTSGDTDGTIAAGDTRTLTVTFTPSAPGTRTAEMSVTGSVDGTDVVTATAALEGTGLEYGSTLSTTAIDFGQVRLGTTSSTQTVTVSNTGTAVLSILGASLPSGSPFRIVSGRSSTTLAPGEGLDVVVEYTPTQAELQASLLEIVTLTGTLSVDVEGRGIQALTASQATLTFPIRLDSETPDTLNAVVTNNNDIDVEVTGISVGGTDASAFAATVPDPLPTLNPGDSTVVPVVLNADTPGEYSASLEVSAGTGTTTIALAGRLLAGPTVSPDTLAYDQVIVGTPETVSVTVENTGAEDLQITQSTGITSTTEGLSVITPLPVTVAAGDTANLDVRYDPPTAVGAVEGELTVETQTELDPDGTSLYTARQAVPVTARVVTPPQLTVEPAALNFGAVVVGQTARTLPIRFINTGGATLTVSSAGFEVNDGTFTLSTTPTGTIAPGDTLGFTMTAQVDASGEVNSLFQVASDGGTASLDARVRGIDIDLQVADMQIGQPAEVTATLPTFTTLNDNALYVRTGGAASFERIPLTQETEVEWTAELPARLATLRGLDYYFLVDDGQDTITLPASTRSASRQNPVHKRVAFESVTTPMTMPPGGYRMVSVPAEVDASTPVDVFGDDYGEFNPRVWRLLRYDPDLGDYREAQGIDAVQKGDGLWLATREGALYTVGPGRSTDASAAITLEVQPGWNQIATPFGFPVAWQDIENTASLETPVLYDGDQYTYGGSVLRPWSAVWVFNPTDQAVGITVPPVAADAGGSTPNATVAHTPADPDDGYTLQIRARVQDGNSTLRDDATYAGVRKGAADGADSLDFAKAPPIGDHVRVSITAGDRRLAGSYVPESDDGYVWNAELTAFTETIRSGGRENVRLQVVEHGTRPSGYDLYVFDLERQISLPVTKGQVTVPVDGNGPVSLRIVAGSESFATSKSNGIALEQLETALDKTYPNPIANNETATIDFQLESAEHVRLEVYDLLGRRVAVLLDERKTAGPHTVTWNTQSPQSRLASGVYFLRMRAGDFTATRKMTIVR